MVYGSVSKQPPLLPCLAVVLLATVATEASSPPTPIQKKWLEAMPEEMVLHAPYTPFRADYSLNATKTMVDGLAAQAAAFGVTTVWVPGTMGQFETLTIAERKELVARWVEAGHRHGLYIIAHVGTNSIEEARDLAAHAQKVGADAIASVPPFYGSVTDVDAIVAFLGEIAKGAAELPLFYYHIPGTTHATIKAMDLFASAQNNGLHSLMGVKYVSTDMGDWFNLVATYNTTKALLFAPEPKLASFGLGIGRGTVLAEDFFAGTYRRMKQSFFSSSSASTNATLEQAWKLAAGAVFGQYGGGSAERTVYGRFPHTCELDLGPPRLPSKPITQEQKKELFKALDSIDFWNRL